MTSIKSDKYLKQFTKTVHDSLVKVSKNTCEF